MKFWALWLVAMTLEGSSPAFWEMSTYQDFVRGKFHGVSIGRNGSLSAAPELEMLFAPGEAYVWALAQAPDGGIYVGTGNRGRLYRVDAAGKGKAVWSAPEPEIFAIAVDKAGVVYAGTSPGGKIYRIEADGRSAVYFDPKATYIWALAIGNDGALYAGTGGEGKVFRVTQAGKGEVYYETGQTNVTGLAFDREGRLLAGSEPNGILYRIAAKDKAFVLYDSNLPEIRAMATGPDGSIYAAGLGGAVAKKSQSPAPGGPAPAGGVPTVTTSITVTADTPTGGEIKPVTAEPAKPAAATPAAATPVVTAELTGVEKSAIYRIYPDNTVETLWSSKEENVYDVLVTGSGLLFCTDVGGHIFRMSPERQIGLIAETDETEAARLFQTKSGTLVATGTVGRLYRIGDAAEAGEYESPAYDAGSVARWGRVRGQGSGGAVIQTRSGNSARPDKTWSEWSAAVELNGGAAISSPNARFLVWRVKLPAASIVSSVSVGYLAQNNPPVVRSITALTTVQPSAAPTKGTGNSSSAATTPYTMTVTDTGDGGPVTSTGTPTQTLSRAGQQQLILSWQADDPDGDRLVYTLSFRGEGEQEWKFLKRDLHENTYAMDGDALADGRYWFRVEASDREMNAGASARTADLVSSPVLIDNTPPAVTVKSVRGTVVEFEASDAASVLKRCEYAVDGGAWIPVVPLDGILDSRTASFRIEVTGRAAGEHVLALRVYDSGNNAGLAKVILH